MEHTPASLPFAGAITRAEFERVQTLLLPKWARWYVLYPVLAAVFLAFTLPGARLSEALIDDVGFVVLFPVVMLVVTRRIRARAWKQVQRLGGEVHGAITPAGIDWNTARTSTRFEWDKIIRVVREPGMTLAFFTAHSAFFFPRSFFPSDQAWTEFNDALVRYAAK